MLLALRSLWEQAGSNVSFPVTGVAADPQVGAIIDVAGTASPSSGGGSLALLRHRVAQQLAAERIRDLSFTLRGVAAKPRVGEITSVAITMPVAGVSAVGRAFLPGQGAFGNQGQGSRLALPAADSVLVHVDFATGKVALANAYIGEVPGCATGFQAGDGVSACPVIEFPAHVDTTFDLLEEEWLALLLAA